MRLQVVDIAEPSVNFPYRRASGWDSQKAEHYLFPLDDGRALVLSNTAAAFDLLATDLGDEDLDADMPLLTRTRLANRLSLNLSQSKTRDVIREITMGKLNRPERDALGRRTAYRFRLGNLLFYEIPYVAGGATVTDDFNRVNSTDLGVNWTEVLGNLEINTNLIRPTSTSGSISSARHNTALASPDMLVSVLIQLHGRSEGSGGNETTQGGAARFSPSAASYYTAVWSQTRVDGAGQFRRKIFQTLAGTRLQLATSGPVAQGFPQTIRTRVNGNTIEWVDAAGNVQQTVTNANITVGNHFGVSFHMEADSNLNFDNMGITTVTGEDLLSATEVSDSDVGGGVDAQIESAILSGTEQGAVAETNQRSVFVLGGESGSGSDAGVQVAAVQSTEAGTGSESESQGVEDTLVSQADSGTGADTADTAAGASSTDSGAGSEAQSPSAALQGSESATGADQVTARGSSSRDAGVGAESQLPGAQVGSSDQAFGNDSETRAVLIVSTDTGIGFVEQVLAVVVLEEDFGVADEDFATLVEILSDDLGVFTEEELRVVTSGLPDIFTTTSTRLIDRETRTLVLPDGTSTSVEAQPNAVRLVHNGVQVVVIKDQGRRRSEVE